MEMALAACARISLFSGIKAAIRNTIVMKLENAAAPALPPTAAATQSKLGENSKYLVIGVMQLR